MKPTATVADARKRQRKLEEINSGIVADLTEIVIEGYGNLVPEGATCSFVTPDECHAFVNWLERRCPERTRDAFFVALVAMSEACGTEVPMMGTTAKRRAAMVRYTTTDAR